MTFSHLQHISIYNRKQKFALGQKVQIDTADFILKSKDGQLYFDNQNTEGEFECISVEKASGDRIKHIFKRVKDQRSEKQ